MEPHNKIYKVVLVQDPETLILNCGEKNNIQIGQRFLIYSMGEEIFDPDTKKSLGKLEIVSGTGRVSHVQDGMCTIKSDMKGPERKVIKQNKGLSSLGIGSFGFLPPIETEEFLPGYTKNFETPDVGYLAKRI